MRVSTYRSGGRWIGRWIRGVGIGGAFGSRGRGGRGWGLYVAQRRRPAPRLGPTAPIRGKENLAFPWLALNVSFSNITWIPGTRTVGYPRISFFSQGEPPISYLNREEESYGKQLGETLGGWNSEYLVHRHSPVATPFISRTKTAGVAGPDLAEGSHNCNPSDLTFRLLPVWDHL